MSPHIFPGSTVSLEKSQEDRMKQRIHRTKENKKISQNRLISEKELFPKRQKKVSITTRVVKVSKKYSFEKPVKERSLFESFMSSSDRKIVEILTETFAGKIVQ